MKHTISEIICHYCEGVTISERVKAEKLADAAPELLEALIKIAHMDDELCKCPACKIGKPAIKKATQ